MPDEKPPSSISFEGDEWLQHFIYAFELEYNEISKASLLPAANKSDTKRNVLFAVKRLLSEAGMTTQEMQSVIEDDRYGWTEKKNSRRFELIEKKLDVTLSFQENWELDSLTLQLRYAMNEVEQSRVNYAKEIIENLSDSVDQTGKSKS